MTKIRVTKEFRFEMAHALWNYDGKCKNLHGHSYILNVTVIGEPVSDPLNSKCGMVIDFGDLKKIVNDAITDKMDHSVVFNKEAPTEQLLSTPEMFDRRHVVKFQPTCENLVVDFAEKLQKCLPPSVYLHSLRLYETAGSFAEWFADDNNN
jgi:6-pyruvoyltetrahydropterin/6-carboxytetrahydropterin synthase